LPERFKIDELLKNVVGYLETRVELVKLEAKEEVAKILARLLLFTLLMLLFAMFVIISSITFGLYLNYLLESAFLGMVIVSGFYFLILVILITTRNAPFWKRFIRKMISADLNEDDDYDGA
jgi:uncharacterized membrane protein YqjE